MQTRPFGYVIALRGMDFGLRCNDQAASIQRAIETLDRGSMTATVGRE